MACTPIALKHSSIDALLGLPVNLDGTVASAFDVVHTMEEAYAMVGVRREDFTEHIYPEPQHRAA